MKENPDKIKPILKGRVSGIDKHFAITDVDYLNATLDSTEEIKVLLESIGEMVMLHIENPSKQADTAQITVGGLRPNTSYYLYEHCNHTHPKFTTDKNGSCSFTQDISQSHLLFIQMHISNYILDDNGFSDPDIGTWDSTSRTATLNKDIYKPLEIIANDVTLKGHKQDNTMPVIFTAESYGIFINEKNGITIENIEITSASIGIAANRITNSIIRGSLIHNNYYGVCLFDSSSNAIQNNTVYSNHGDGIELLNCDFNMIKNNNIYDNGFWGIYIDESSSNIIKNNEINNNRRGILMGLHSDFNKIQHNNISCNDIGLTLGGNGNLATYNNLIKNEANVLNNGSNTFSHNYSDDWAGDFPLKYLIDRTKTSFKQLSVQEYLTIPIQKPCAEEILNCLVDAEITHVKVIKTPRSTSYEGQSLRGYKAIIEGRLLQKIDYVADEPSQQVHAAHFNTPFSTYMILEDNYMEGTKLNITSTIEDVYYKLLDKRCIFKNITLYLEAKSIE